MESVAVLGTGRMGAAAARRLLEAGHPTTVWNRTPQRSMPLVSAGAELASTPAEAVRDATAVVTFLTDASAVEAVLFGAFAASGRQRDTQQVAAAAMAPGTTLLQMSTIGPAAVSDIARRLPSEVRLLDAPVSGSVPHVDAAKLKIYVGGDDSAARRVAPLLAALGTTVRCGDVGSASAVKLTVNAAMIAAVAALAEVAELSAALKVPGDVAREAIAAGPLAAALARAEADGAQFAVTHARKDLRLAAAASETELPLLAACDASLARVGDPAADLGAVVDLKE